MQEGKPIDRYLQLAIRFRRRIDILILRFLVGEEQTVVLILRLLVGEEQMVVLILRFLVGEERRVVLILRFLVGEERRVVLILRFLVGEERRVILILRFIARLPAIAIHAFLKERRPHDTDSRQRFDPNEMGAGDGRSNATLPHAGHESLLPNGGGNGGDYPARTPAPTAPRRARRGSLFLRSRVCFPRKEPERGKGDTSEHTHESLRTERPLGGGPCAMRHRGRYSLHPRNRFELLPLRWASDLRTGFSSGLYLGRRGKRGGPGP